MTTVPEPRPHAGREVTAKPLAPSGDVSAPATIETMVVDETLPLAPKRSTSSVVKMGLTMAALAAMSGAFLFFPIDWNAVGNWGYLGVFVTVFIATASFVLPIPYLLIVARAATFLNPYGVAGVAGVAAALGELTGYFLGISGRDLVARGKWYEKAEYMTKTYGFWCIAFFSFVPNPFFDAVGFAAGVLRYPLWRFMLACFLGKYLKFLVAALVGDQAAAYGLID